MEVTKELKLYSSRKEEKPVIIEKASNFYKIVSESKEVTKMYSMLSGCMHGIKMEFTEFIKVWNRLSFDYSDLSYPAEIVAILSN